MTTTGSLPGHNTNKSLSVFLEEATTHCQFKYWKHTVNRGGVLEDTIWSFWSRRSILGLGLKPCKFSKIPCPRLKNSTVFWLVENGPRSWATSLRLGAHQRLKKNNFWRLYFVKNLRICGRKPFLYFFYLFLFFWWTLLRCVLGVWPQTFWPLAPIGSVLGRCVLGLGVFWCPYPQALCPQLHLWLLITCNTDIWRTFLASGKSYLN